MNIWLAIEVNIMELAIEFQEQYFDLHYFYLK